MINTLILFFIVVAVFALVYWGMTQLPLPPTIRTVIIVIMGLLALLFIYQIFVGGGHMPVLR